MFRAVDAHGPFPRMSRPISALISATALRHNLQRIRQTLDAARAPGQAPAKTWSVIKANAYGHHIEAVLDGLRQTDGFAMLELDEAQRCRAAGWRGPILLIEGVFEPGDVREAVALDTTLVLHGFHGIKVLEAGGGAPATDVYVKLNTGMNRLGFREEELGQALARLQGLQDQGKLGRIGFMTHCATADGPQGIADQLAHFQQAVQGRTGPVSVANSAACLRFPEQAGDWVRPGIALYGASPFTDQSAASMGFRPVMTFRAELIGVQTLKPGEGVGYGFGFVAEQAMRVGVVACGYADGYPRHARTGTPIQVHGRRTRTLGTVSMDMLAVDLRGIPEAGIGSEVILWGAAGPSVDEVADAAGTIGYELLTAVAPRVKRRIQE